MQWTETKTSQPSKLLYQQEAEFLYFWYISCWLKQVAIQPSGIFKGKIMTAIGVILGILLALGLMLGVPYYGFSYLHTTLELGIFTSIVVLGYVTIVVYLIAVER